MSQIAGTPSPELTYHWGGEAYSGIDEELEWLEHSFQQPNLVENVAETSKPLAEELSEEPKGRVKAALEPLREDHANCTKREKALMYLGVVAIGANYSQVRPMLTLPLELGVAQATNPLVAGVVGAAIHWSWFMSYGRTLGGAARRFPKTLRKIAQRLPVEKANVLPGLEPGSTIPPAEIDDPIRQRVERLKLRNERRLAMKGTGTATYIALAALQGQTIEDQKKLCMETVNEGTVGALFKTVALTGSVALVSKFDPNLAKSIVEASRTPEVMLPFTFGPLAILTGLRAMRRRQQSKVPSEIDLRQYDSSRKTILKYYRDRRELSKHLRQPVTVEGVYV
jgi:hypothetical protein